jgi:hypothetical protein
MRSILILTCLALLGPVSCSEVVTTSGPHPATTPGEVKIYTKPPGKYEILGTVTMPLAPDKNWEGDNDGTETIDNLKAQAAALGANGLLLAIDPKTYDYQLGLAYHNKNYNVPIKNNPRTAMADAIYMINKSRLFDPNTEQ